MPLRCLMAPGLNSFANVMGFLPEGKALFSEGLSYENPVLPVAPRKPAAHWNQFSEENLLRQAFGSSILSLSPTLNPAAAGNPEPVNPYEISLTQALWACIKRILSSPSLSGLSVILTPCIRSFLRAEISLLSIRSVVV
ncbi:MAG: hypothetical protein QG577_1979 [Thermodesulfobacteriota bacterium]|nr:hypothetical protein [Thermodesulfobacteriota bacterium]